MAPKSSQETTNTGTTSKKQAAPGTSIGAAPATKKQKSTPSSTPASGNSRTSPLGSTRNGTVTFEEVVDVDALDSDNEATEDPAETSEAELERLKETWTSPIYAFFKPEVVIGYEDSRRYHEFHCAAKPCTKNSHTVRRYLDKTDKALSSSLRKHAYNCWTKETVQAACTNYKDATDARAGLEPHLSQPRTRSITLAFERTGKGKVTYSHNPLTKNQTRTTFVQWVAENGWLYSIVKDAALHKLVKTGRPGSYIPSVATVSRDVRNVFVNCRKRIAKLLREYDGELSFETDAWTSPNHKPLIAVTVHFVYDGAPLTLFRQSTP